MEAPHTLRFEGSEFPPRPAGYQRATAAADELTIVKQETLVATRVTELRALAESDPRLKAAVGSRHTFLRASAAEVEKTEAAVPQEVRLAYFNYATGRAVYAWVREGKVREVKVKPPGFQPPESPEEIERAARIVAANPKFAREVEGQPAAGLLTPAPRGRRYVYVRFGPVEKNAVFDAVVDLTSGRVVRAGPVEN